MRRPATLTAIMVGLAVLAAGCGSKPAATPGAVATASTTLSPEPAATTAASPSATGTGSGSGCGMSGTVTGGDGAALDVMKAWLQCDTAKLHTLMQNDAYQQLHAVGAPNIDGHWTFVNCDGAMGSSYCTFRNKLGSDVIIRLQNGATDHPVTEFKLDRTVYHNDPEKYAREFLDAFINHNKPRMVTLASQSIVDSIVVDAPPAGYDLTLSPDPHWVYNAHFDTGEYWVVTIHGTLGKAHAITAFGNAG
ncbi:hypothetical protein [Catellatospora tritici]|uniref:hypothetical protein n=1 Tax=Catellatospora tritici TaxID=2851566 RepID=UPI001C2D8640|nr:hypothetical protein [Catellatospora tritici]MBV1850772.1 hypothetical protein [Catellatospora tritici]MBV1851025.1 hypothetical protein [Catellatospora tritici]